MSRKIGLRIKTERTKLKLTQVELAEKLNISSNFLGEIERGQKFGSVDTLISFANYFGVSTDYLLFGNKNIKEVKNGTEIKNILYHLYHDIDALHKQHVPLAIEILRAINKLLK